MKTKLIFAGLLTSALTINAQYISTSGTAPGGTQLYRAGNGTSTGLHVTASGGVLIQSQSGDRGLLEIHDPTDANKTVFQSLSNATYLGSLSSSIPLAIQDQGGFVGIGTSGPTAKLDVRGGGVQAVNPNSLPYTFIGRDANPGVNDSYWYHRITNNYHILGSNQNGSGTLRKLGFAIGGSDLETDVKMTVDLIGNVGIGTNTPDLAKLQVYQTGANNCGSCGANAAGLFHISNYNSGQNMGVNAFADDGNLNVGGLFLAGAYSSSSAQNIGVWGEAAFWTNANNWAGFLNGQTYCPAGVWTASDRNLKDNIKPLTGAMDKIKLLNPSTYTFKTSEFKGLALPEGEQMGLIAQEVESIFPELVSEFKSVERKDDKGNVVSSVPTHKNMNYTGLIPLLIAGMKEQQKMIEDQNSTIDALKKQVGELKGTSASSEQTKPVTGIVALSNFDGNLNMSQNEPNPFTHETVVRYLLPQTVNNAYMSVYDLTGKQITTFPITEKGSSSIIITSEKLSAGIYIYSIVADGKIVDSKRMVVENK